MRLLCGTRERLASIVVGPPGNHTYADIELVEQRVLVRGEP